MPELELHQRQASHALRDKFGMVGILEAGGSQILCLIENELLSRWFACQIHILTPWHWVWI